MTSPKAFYTLEEDPAADGYLIISSSPSSNSSNTPVVTPSMPVPILESESNYDASEMVCNSKGSCFINITATNGLQNLQEELLYENISTEPVDSQTLTEDDTTEGIAFNKKTESSMTENIESLEFNGELSEEQSTDESCDPIIQTNKQALTNEQAEMANQTTSTTTIVADKSSDENSLSDVDMDDANANDGRTVEATSNADNATHIKHTHNHPVKYEEPADSMTSRSQEEYGMVQKNGDTDDYTHENVSVNETTRLLSSSNRRKQRRCGLSCRVIGLIALMAVVGLGVGIVISLYETGMLAHNGTSNGTLDVFQNDSVLVSYNIPKTNFYSYSVTVESSTNMPPELQSDLFLLDKRNSEAIQTLELVEHSPETKFDSCSNFICPLDLPPPYLAVSNVASQQSVLILDVSIDSFIPQGQTSILITVFDDLYHFREFMATGDASSAIKVKSMRSKNYMFELTSDDLQKSGYVYFAIQRLDNTTEWFSAQLSGIRAYYNTSSLTPYCTMDESNGHRCVISGLDGDKEILARVRDNDAGTTAGHSNWLASFPSYIIEYSVGNPKTNTFGQLVFGSAFITMIVGLMVMAMTCCLCYCRQRRSNRYWSQSERLV